MTGIIGQYRRYKRSVEKTMIEIYLTSASTGRTEDASEILWDSSVSVATVSNLNEEVLSGRGMEEQAHPYV